MLALPVAIVGGITPNSFEVIDLFMFVFSSLLVCVLARRDHKITRRSGVLMLLTFLLYYGFIIYSAVV